MSAAQADWDDKMRGKAKPAKPMDAAERARNPRSQWSREQEEFYHTGFVVADDEWRNAMKFSDFGEAMLWVELAKKDLMARYGTIWPPTNA